LLLDKARSCFTSEEIISEFNEWVGKLDNEIFLIKSSTVRWLKEREEFDLKAKIIKDDHKAGSKGGGTFSVKSSKHSHSSHGSSRNSSRSSKYEIVEEETELSELKVRKQFAEKRVLKNKSNIWMKKSLFVLLKLKF